MSFLFSKGSLLRSKEGKPNSVSVGTKDNKINILSFKSTKDYNRALSAQNRIQRSDSAKSIKIIVSMIIVLQ